MQNKATVKTFTNRFGADYFAFWAGGVRCIVLNSSLHAGDLWQNVLDAGPGGINMTDKGEPHTAATLAQCKAECEAMAADQDAWLDAELEALRGAGAAHAMVFTHVPPFCESDDEPADSTNYPTEARTTLFPKLKAAGVTKWFSGHYHRNAGGWSDDMEVIVSAACGVMGAVNDQPLPGGQLSPNLKNGKLGQDVSGLRLVCVDKEVVGHKWFAHADVPEEVDPVADARSWAAQGRPDIIDAKL